MKGAAFRLEHETCHPHLDIFEIKGDAIDNYTGTIVIKQTSQGDIKVIYVMVFHL